jgi:hypothetical protein
MLLRHLHPSLPGPICISVPGSVAGCCLIKHQNCVQREAQMMQNREPERHEQKLQLGVQNKTVNR